MSNSDYYEILGVKKDATAGEIRHAYRKGARKYHPDICQTAEAEARFKEINEANEVLKDPDKRKRYDLYGQNWRNGEVHQDNYQSFYSDRGRPQEDEQFSDFFRTIFESASTDNDPFGYQSAHHRPRTSPIYQAQITLSLQELFNSEPRLISFQTSVMNRQGKIETREKTLKVKIPKGVTDGSTIRLPDIDKNESGVGGSDLLLKVHVRGDSTFRIDGYDLETNVSLAPWEAALGAKIAVKTVDGYVTLTVPPATSSGKRFRLRGKGLPKRDNSAGDIIVETVIQIPDSLSAEEKRLFQELAEKSEYDPRSKEQYNKYSKVR